MSSEQRRLDDAAWSFVGRVDELYRFRRFVANPRTPGLVLAGPAGVGKTRTALECLAIANDMGLATARAVGHHAAAELPFAALAHLLPGGGSYDGAVAQDGSDLLQRFVSAFTSIGGDTRLVLMVDDAHLLDPASATLVHQLAVTNSVFVLATVRAGESASDPIVALWKDGLLERIELAGLPVRSLEKLISSVLGAPVDPGTIMTLADRCGGNVLFLRELVLGAVGDGTLRQNSGMWRLDGPLHPSNRLVELVETRLSGLKDDERALLELVSFAEPLGQAEMKELGDWTIAEDLERKGLLSVGMNGRRLEVRLGHPVYGDVLRASLPVLRSREMARSLAEVIEATGTRRREDILRVGGWRLAAGGGGPQLMLAAAKAARWRYDFGLAERLVQAAQELGAGFDADLLAAKLTSIQGFSAEAETALAAMDAAASDDGQRSLITTARMDNFLYANRSEDSLRVAAAAEASIADRRWRDDITAQRSAILVNTAGPRETFATVEPLLDGAGTSALVWACLTGARSLARLGRTNAAIELTVRGKAAHESLSAPIEWYPWFHQFNQCDALVSAGRLHEAAQLAGEQHQRGLAEYSPESQGCFALQLAKVCVGRGRVTAAANYAREAVAVFKRIGRPMFLHEALHILALAQALADSATEAGKSLQELDALELPPTMYDAADLLQARAWAAVADGHIPKATSFLEQAIELATSIGDLVVAASTLHDMARLGKPKVVVDRLEDLAGEVETELVAVRAAHVRCLIANDAEGLSEVSSSFAEFGADLLAADSAADAAVAWTKLGHHRAAAASTRKAIEFVDRCEGASTPAVRSIDARARLTPAERETATLAAAGYSNKYIAKELVLSVRSIENRLQHVYDKLGINGRDELAEALNLNHSPSSD